MIATFSAMYRAGAPAGEPPKHIPHSLIPLLKFAHGVPLIVGLLVIVLLIFYAGFKLTHMRSA